MFNVTLSFANIQALQQASAALTIAVSTNPHLRPLKAVLDKATPIKVEALSEEQKLTPPVLLVGQLRALIADKPDKYPVMLDVQNVRSTSGIAAVVDVAYSYGVPGYECVELVGRSLHNVTLPEGCKIH